MLLDKVRVEYLSIVDFILGGIVEKDTAQSVDIGAKI